MPDIRFEDQLPRLLEQFFEDGDMGLLASALGCTTLRYGSECSGRWDSWSLYSPDQPPIQCEGLVCQSLLAALMFAEPPKVVAIGSAKKLVDYLKTEKLASLVDGLHRNRRWMRCLDTLDGAHRLAALLVTFPALHYSARSFVAGASLTQAISAGAYSIANEWLQPNEPYAGGALVGAFICEKLARSIFGNAWCDLMLDGVEFDRMPSPEMYDFIVSSKPPFRPGLLPDHLVQPAVPLPEMTTP
jgi:hypothetical protein